MNLETCIYCGKEYPKASTVIDHDGNTVCLWCGDGLEMEAESVLEDDREARAYQTEAEVNADLALDHERGKCQ